MRDSRPESAGLQPQRRFKESELRWQAIGEQAVTEVVNCMREIIKDPGDGIITIEIERSKGKIYVKPEPSIRFLV